MKLKIPFLVLLIIAGIIGGLQASSVTVQAGDWYYKQFNFKKALPFYLKALKKNPGDKYVESRIANSYRLTNDWEKAEKYYSDISTDSSEKGINRLYYAQALMANKKYAEAKVAYKSYLDLNPNNQGIKDTYEEFGEIAELSQDRGYYDVKNLEKVNSAYSDFGVSFFGTKGLIFCSNRWPDAGVVRKDNWTHNNFLTIYTSLRKDSTAELGKPTILNSHILNRKFHDGTSSYNDKMQELYVDRSNYNGRRAFFSADKTVKLKIYKLSWLEAKNDWSSELAEAVPFNDKEYSIAHPSLSKDGKTLFFASDKPGGYGGADIYMCTREIGGQWGTPINLGSKVNTAGDDMFPFVADDGTLYFASNGHVGLGGLDIFSVTPVVKAGQIAGWTRAQNLGAPVNTNADDFGYIIDNENHHGYLCSNRQGGKGDDDIYSFTKNIIQLNGIVYDKTTDLPIQGAEVVMKDADVERGKMESGSGGDFSFTALANHKYDFSAKKEGYEPASLGVDVKDKPELVKIPMEPMGPIKLDITVLDKKTRDLLADAKVKLIDVATNKEEVCTTGILGKCEFILDPEKRYLIEGSKETGNPDERYLKITYRQATLGMKGPKVIYVILELEKVKKNVAIKLENIYYDYDKWFIRPDAAVELDKLVKILKDNPTIEIELSSHTDCRGTANYNLNLSGKRAQSAVAYIESQGIDMKRMRAAGYGESKLMNKCKCEGKVIVTCTEEQHQENRRTEFTVLKF